ncbi:MAG: HPr family phosphocarrier protein [Pseudomonadota bacterium]
MLRCKAKIINERGLHVRPAARFVAVVSEFEASITVANGERSADGKSILGMMTLAARHGAELAIEIDGSDEVAMAQTLAQEMTADLTIDTIEPVPDPPCR